MALSFLLDENARGPLWDAIRRSGAIDAIRVGDPPESPVVPLGTPDHVLLERAASLGRILVTFDRQTIPGYLADRLAAGGHSPGVLVIRPGSRLVEVVETLEIAASCSTAEEWRDLCRFVPL